MSEEKSSFTFFTDHLVSAADRVLVRCWCALLLIGIKLVGNLSRAAWSPRSASNRSHCAQIRLPSIDH